MRYRFICSTPEGISTEGTGPSPTYHYTAGSSLGNKDPGQGRTSRPNRHPAQDPEFAGSPGVRDHYARNHPPKATEERPSHRSHRLFGYTDLSKI